MAARTVRFQDDKFWTKHNSDRSQDRIGKAFREGNVTNVCAACGAVLNPETAKQVHIVDGGSRVLYAADEALYVPDGGDMGCWSLGPECAKMFPAASRAAVSA